MYQPRFLAGLLTGVGLAVAVSVLAAPANKKVPEPLTYARWNQTLVLVDRLMAIPEDRIDIGEVALQLNTILAAGVDVREGQRRLGEMTARVAELVGNNNNPATRINAINQVIFKEQGFGYDMDDLLGRKLENRLLWSTLQRHKGNCITLPLLWLSIATALGYPVSAVEAPLHMFVRYEDGDTRINLEITSGGHPARDEYIIQGMGVSDEAIKSGAAMRSLSKKEVLGLLIADVANQLRLAMDLGTALELHKKALALHPKNYSIHWGLASLYNEVAYAMTYEQIVVAREKGEKDIMIPREFVLAQDHAKKSMQMGAVKLPSEDELKNAVVNAGKETAKPRINPSVYDLVTMLQPDTPLIHLQWDIPREDLGMMISPMRGMACVESCAKACGPAPGNLCARYINRWTP